MIGERIEHCRVRWISQSRSSSGRIQHMQRCHGPTRNGFWDTQWLAKVFLWKVTARVWQYNLCASVGKCLHQPSRFPACQCPLPATHQQQWQLSGSSHFIKKKTKDPNHLELIRVCSHLNSLAGDLTSKHPNYSRPPRWQTSGYLNRALPRISRTVAFTRNYAQDVSSSTSLRLFHHERTDSILQLFIDTIHHILYSTSVFTYLRILRMYFTCLRMYFTYVRIYFHRGGGGVYLWVRIVFICTATFNYGTKHDFQCRWHGHGGDCRNLPYTDASDSHRDAAIFSVCPEIICNFCMIWF